MIRIAAVGDLHFGEESRGTYAAHLERLPDVADLLLVAGDLTRLGDPAEAAVVARELASVTIPVFAVLGNHDYHLDRAEAITGLLEDAGVRVLEGEAAVVEAAGMRVGIAGAKGFGGGFAGACGTEFGEPEMKAFVAHTRRIAEQLESAAGDVAGTDVRITMLHYAPIEGTLRGERPEIFPFLGSYLLGEAVDRCGADLVVHGHAHRGTERGLTPGGIPVRNVAQPVVGAAFGLYCLQPGEASAERVPAPAAQAG